LIFIFTVWNPAGLALRLGAGVLNVASQTPLSLVLFAVRLVITGIGVAAGRALWLRRPGAVSLAKAALMLFGVEAVLRLSTRFGLSDAPPGTRLPLALFLILHNGAWYLYLERSRRVQAIYDPGVQP
jgi:hypothetical protein